MRGSVGSALITVHGLLSLMTWFKRTMSSTGLNFSSDGDRQRAKAFYQIDQRGHTHPKGRIMMIIIIITRGQSNLTKSASRGPIPWLGVTPGGRNLYHCIPGVGFPIIGLGCTVWPQCTRVTTNQPTNDQRRHDTAYLNKRLFY